MVSKVAEAFFWGSGGRKLTPEQLAAEQEEVRKKKGKYDTSPVGHWTQGAARMVESLGNVLQERRLMNQQNALLGDSQKRMSSWFSPVAEALTTQPESVVEQPITAPVAPVVAEELPALGSPVAEALATPVVEEAYRDPAVTVVNDAPVPPKDIPNPPKLSGNKQAFIEALLPTAIEVGQQIGVDPRIIVAQAAQETGWGRSAPGNNFFGIKSHGKSGGQNLTTHEYINGKRVKINDSFRTFESPADSVRGYGEFLQKNPRYKPMMQAKGLEAQLAELQKSGYATDPNYSRSVGAIANSIQLPAGQSVASALAPQNVPTPAPSPVQANMGGIGNINPQAVMKSLMDPFATPQERQGAQMMLGMYQQQQERQREIQLRQQALQNRQAIAQQMGFDPAFANDEIAFKAMLEKANKDRATATVGSNLVDPNTGQVIYSAPAEPTANQKEYQDYVKYETQLGRTPLGPLEYAQSLRKSGANQTNINMGGEKFSEEFGKNDAKLLADVDTAGIQAARNLARIDQLGSLLGNIETGGAASLKQFAGEWGINTEGLSDIQAAQAMVNSLVPEQRQPGSGPMSDADLALFKQSLPRIINTPEGNRMIIDTMRGIAQYDAEGAAIVQQLRDEKITRSDAFRMLRERKNPLEGFKGSSNNKSQSGPSRISDKSQYDSLPSGSEYIAPDGSVRRKP